MKQYQLKELIREVMQEAIQQESKASDEAKRQGLQYFGFGRYGKDGKLTHKSERGRLVPAKGPDDTGLRPGKTDKSKNKMYKPGSSVAQAKVLQTGPNKGKLRRLNPRISPQTNRDRNKPSDELELTGATTNPFYGTDGGDVKRRLSNKLINIVRDKELSGRYSKKELLQHLGVKPQSAKTVLRFIDKKLGYDDTDFAGINKERDGTYTVNQGN